MFWGVNYLYSKPISYWDDIWKTAFYLYLKSNVHCKSFCNLSFIYGIFHLQQFKILIYLNLFVVFSIVSALF